jgi:hypothetical protein
VSERRAGSRPTLTAPSIAVIDICVTPNTYLSPPGVDKMILFLLRCQGKLRVSMSG